MIRFNYASVLSLVVPCVVGCWNSGNVYFIAEYPSAQFHCSHDKCYSLYTGGHNNSYQIIDIHLRFEDGKTARLREITEDTARKWVASKSEPLQKASVREVTDRKGIKRTEYDLDGHHWLSFRDGKLVDCHIGGPLDRGPLKGVQIGTSADGEFLAFPVSREDLVRILGQPRDVRKATHRPPS
jgi:hypothetical protein